MKLAARIFLLATAGAAAAATIALVRADVAADAASSKPSQFRLAYAGTDGMTVSWSTPAKQNSPTVYYGTLPFLLIQRASSSESVTFPTSTYYSNHVALRSLRPNTQYFYRVGNDGPLNSFRTARRAGDHEPNQRVAWSGDMGTFGDLGLGTKAPPSTHPLMTGEVTTVQRLASESNSDYWYKEEKAGYLNGTIADGTKLYNDILQGFYDELTPFAASKPYMVVPGNHDSSCTNFALPESDCPIGQTNFTGYINHWRMPSAQSGGVGNFWYSFDSGMVHYVMLDSETDLGNGIIGPEEKGGSSGGFDGPFGAVMNAQVDWLKKDLAAVDRKRTPWVVAGFHRPYYVAASKCTVCQQAFEKLLNDGGVDVVLSGHVHNTERHDPTAYNVTDPAGLNNPKAPWYLTNGAAGHYDGIDALKLPLPSYTRFANDTLYTWSRLTFHNSTHVTNEYLSSATGDVIDAATLYKKH